MRDLARLGLTLMLICVVAGLGLSVVYDKTKPVIEQRAEQDFLVAIQDAIPGADSLEEKAEGDKTYFVGYKGGNVLGAAMKVEARGYGQTPMELIVGVDAEGTITKVIVLSMSETPGIGTKVKEPSYLSQYAGITEPSTVDGISGASYSSRALQGGVSSALDFILGALDLGGKAEIVLANTPDGTYEGAAEGLLGPIKVSVTVEGGKLVSVKILQHEETQSIAAPALSGIPKAMVEEQDIDVDAVSGATFTSHGIIEAVKAALGPVQPQEGAVDLTRIPDGTYQGTGNGLMGDIKVSVEMEDGKIASVKITGESETPDIAKPAFTKVPKKMVESQEIDVDTVSGATFTSKGIIEAVRNALAGKEE